MANKNFCRMLLFILIVSCIPFIHYALSRIKSQKKEHVIPDPVRQQCPPADIQMPIVQERIIEREVVKVVTRNESECTMHFLIPSVPRPDDKPYLNKTVHGILDLQTFFFKPCIHVFNMRGDSYASKIRTLIPSSHPLVNVHDLPENPEIIFRNPSLRASVQAQGTDFVRMLERTLKVVPSDALVMIMEDDFIFCPSAVYHLARILEDSKQKDPNSWIAYRMSFGLNGVLMKYSDILPTVQFLWANRDNQLPIDWLVEYYWTIDDFPARLKWYNAVTENHKKKLYTYRYQLLEHIGFSSSIGSRGYTMPRCYEYQTASGLAQYFDMNACPHSLFHPCNADKVEFRHDSVLEKDLGFFIQPVTPSEDVLLSKMQNIELRYCAHDCKCCECAEGAFQLLNHCEELKKMLNMPNANCEHGQEEGAPYVEENTIFLSVRKSRMNCYEKTAMTKRICPCYKK